jgi:SAM-dependent methyltransferase
MNMASETSENSLVRNFKRPGETCLYCLIMLQVILLWLYPQELVSQDMEVPYVATPDDVVNEMLNIVNAGSGDYVVDLGSGDGRIVIEAARRGAVGHGVELDSRLVETSFKNAEEAGVSDRVLFLEEDIFETDFSMATVITLYMSNAINLRLRPLFFDTLRPGTRVVSHIFHMDDWKPDVQATVARHNIYVWVIPADAGGKWEWEVDGFTHRLSLDQKFQEITKAGIEILEGGYKPEISEAEINGDRITIVLKNEKENRMHVYNGRVEGDSMTGTVQIHREGIYQLVNWQATRFSGRE